MNLVLVSIVIVQQIGFTIAYMPQIAQLLRTKSSDDISVSFYVVRILSLILLSTVYVLERSVALFYANTISIVIELYIVYLTLKYRKLRKRVTIDFKEANLDYLPTGD